MKTITVKIKRQDQPKRPSYWEEFQIPLRPGMTVITLLSEIQKKPVNSRGEASAPVVFQGECLEELCGLCTFLINGRPMPACSTQADDLGNPVVLEPISKFPVLRDLVVDRSRLFFNFQKVSAWAVDEFVKEEEGRSSLSQSNRVIVDQLSSCIGCGACMEVCPQYNDRSPFMGAAAVAQAHLLSLLFNKGDKASRLAPLMDKGGVDDCGKAQNCDKACPKGIPLTTSIAVMEREVTLHTFAALLGK